MTRTSFRLLMVTIATGIMLAAAVQLVHKPLPLPVRNPVPSSSDMEDLTLSFRSQSGRQHDIHVFIDVTLAPYPGYPKAIPRQQLLWSQLITVPRGAYVKLYVVITERSPVTIYITSPGGEMGNICTGYIDTPGGKACERLPS